MVAPVLHRGLVFVLSVLLFSVSGVSADPRPMPEALVHDTALSRIAVMSESDFTPDRTGATQSSTQGLPAELAARIMEGLSETRRFVPVEREVLRRVVMEQRHEAGPKPPTYLDRTLDAAIADLDGVEGSTVAVTGALSDHNDLIKDFSDLGTTVKADYILFGSLESIRHDTDARAVPYSKSGKSVVSERVSARLRVRVIDVTRGALAAAFSVKIDRELRPAEASNPIASLYDDLSRDAVKEVLDRVFPPTVISLEPSLIDRGSKDGITVGTTFSVTKVAGPVRDTTGATIGSLESEVGSGEVVKVEENFSVIKVTAGAPAKVGDRIKFAKSTAPASAGGASGSPISSSPPATGKKVIAILPFDRNGSLGECDSVCKGYLERLSNELTVNLHKSNRFTVLERSQIDKLLAEKELTSIITDESVKSLAGKLSTVDYLVYGDITDGYVNSTTTHLRVLAEDHTKKEGVYEGTVKVVEAATGKLLAVDKIAVRERLTGTNEKDFDAGVGFLMDRFVDKAAASILRAVYPMMILAVTADGAIYVNRGEDGGLAVGDELRADRLGEELIEPESGIALGRAKTTIGTVTLTEVEQFKSVATSSKPAIEFRKGDVLTALPKKPTPKPSVVKPNW